MVRKVGETHREFKARMIDPVSESFCGAKWYNATIWLGHGGTTSCHHPPAHQIDLEEIMMTADSVAEMIEWVIELEDNTQMRNLSFDVGNFDG